MQQLPIEPGGYALDRDSTRLLYINTRLDLTHLRPYKSDLPMRKMSGGDWL